MRPIRKLLDSNKVFVLVVFGLLAYLAANLWPASYWLTVRSVEVLPASEGERIPMLVSRTVHRPFLGEWTVIVRKWDASGPAVYCTASRSSRYKAGADLPEDLTLTWWTQGLCQPLTPGRYVIGTVWEIKPEIPLFPSRYVEVESNIFEVTP